MRGMNIKQMELAFRGKPFRQSVWYRLFASKRWALLVVHWPIGEEDAG
jgi:hypothetical protein